jgi:formiminoglutamase
LAYKHTLCRKIHFALSSTSLVRNDWRKSTPLRARSRGGHEVGWASYQGVRQWVDSTSAAGVPKATGIVSFDAHFDLRQPAPDTSAGISFRQVAEHCQQADQPFKYAYIGIAEINSTRALIDVATACQVAYTTDLNSTNEAMLPLLWNFLNDVDYLYVTICLDVLPAAIAPV